jgi:hypothetical protein
MGHGADAHNGKWKMENGKWKKRGGLRLFSNTILPFSTPPFFLVQFSIFNFTGAASVSDGG